MAVPPENLRNSRRVKRPAGPAEDLGRLSRSRTVLKHLGTSPARMTTAHEQRLRLVQLGPQLGNLRLLGLDE